MHECDCVLTTNCNQYHQVSWGEWCQLVLRIQSSFRLSFTYKTTCAQLQSFDLKILKKYNLIIKIICNRYNLKLINCITLGIGKLAAGDGKHLADPEVLRRLTSSVSCALDEAAAALTRMRSENPRPQQETR